MTLKKAITFLAVGIMMNCGLLVASAQEATPGVIGDAATHECITDLGTTEAPDGATSYAISSEESTATFLSTEELASAGVNEAVGTTNAVIGTLLLDSEGNPIPCSRIDVDLRTLMTDDARRDNQIQNALDTATNPVATFIVTEVSGLEAPLEEGTETELTLVGNLSINGLEKRVSWDATVTLAEGTMTGSATTVITFDDFELEKPVMGPVMSIEDEISLTIDIVANVAQ